MVRANRLQGRGGRPWQNRFFSCALGRDHLVTALAYAGLNPVRAGLVGCGEQYPWPSARAHLSGRDAETSGRPHTRLFRALDRRLPPAALKLLSAAAYPF